MTNTNTDQNEQHLNCHRCGANPSVAKLNGEIVIVCHCTQLAGEIEPQKLDEMGTLPDRWEFISASVGRQGRYVGPE